MLNKIYPKAKVLITLVSTSKLAVRTGEAEEVANDSKKQKNESTGHESLRVNANGYPVIPGSSLKGMLRKLFTQDLANELFGGQVKLKNTKSNESQKYKRLDGVVNVPAAVSRCHKNDIEIITHASIDEVTGTAKDNHLFSEAWIPEGTEFIWQLDCEFISEIQLERLCSVLLGADLYVGAGQKFGHGKLQVTLEQHNGVPCVQVITSEKLTQWFNSSLKNQSKVAAINPLDDEYTKLPIAIRQVENTNKEILSFDICLSSPDPILIASPAYLASLSKSQTNKDLYYSRDKAGIPVLPNSALRGMFRARFIKIIKTLNEEIEEKQLQKLWSIIWGNKDQRSSFVIRDATLDNKAQFQDHHQTMIAIDRFTGGVKDSALFDVEALTLCSEQYFRSRVSITHRALNRDMFATAIWVLMFADLFDQKLSLGANNSRGYGRIYGFVLVNENRINEVSEFIKMCLDPLGLTQAKLETALMTFIDSAKECQHSE
ncbi:hypothetical protein J8L98_15045 [Pseudoalteromonas sp. MMG013]|uniref:RAMP superfamily CRISPR-associated protein n=1 Tax=Pseudoalteromonas sp. MMG013 TaxID=2822687 RepID=UPI001B3717CE|nr:RAMP superfamily CRISPR-associated protein [Pseudoalteromonas sp. MMG013]MBQ4863002.1 hypothetical protein [Pseudoalteromonas sp. MMG013]